MIHTDRLLERTPMPCDLRLDDLPPHAIAELLASPEYLLSDVEATAVDDFVERIGGIDNAWLAVEMLGQIE